MAAHRRVERWDVGKRDSLVARERMAWRMLALCDEVDLALGTRGDVAIHDSASSMIEHPCLPG